MNYKGFLKFKYIFVIALLALFVIIKTVPVSATRELHFHVHPSGAGHINPIDTRIHIGSDTGAVYTFSAAPASGYAFYRWRGVWDDGGIIWSYSPTTTMACSHLDDAHAQFVRNSQTGIVAKSADESLGNVTGTRPWQWAYDGQSFTISAMPSDTTMYEFDYWDKNGTKVNLGATAEVQMPAISNYDESTGNVGSSSQVVYTAHFKTKGSNHGFKAVVGTDGGGTITSGSFIPYSTWQSAGSASATAKPAEGFDFDCWLASDGSVYSKDLTLNVPYPFPSDDAKSQDIIYTAKFKQHSSVGIMSEAIDESTGNVGGGSVNPAYVEWTTSNANQSINISANPDIGYEFDMWVVPEELKVTGSLSNQSIAVVMPQNRPSDVLKIQAKFKKHSATGIKVEAIDESTGSIGGGIVNPTYVEWTINNANQSINFTASPDTGYEFDTWVIPDGLSVTGSVHNTSIAVVMPQDKPVTDYVIKAYFTEDKTYALYTEVAEQQGGTVTEGKGGTVSPSMVAPDEKNVTEVTLTAEPSDGYEFVEWVDLDSEGKVTFVTDTKEEKVTIKISKKLDMTKDVHVRALFKKRDTIGIWTEAEEGGQASPRFVEWNNQSKNTSVTLTATPDKGYEFDHWEYDDGNGTYDSNYATSASISIKVPGTKPAEDVYYIAVFKSINGKKKNKEIHVKGKETKITKENFLNKWRTWIAPALKYVRSTIENIAHTRVAEDAAVLESNKTPGIDAGSVAAGLKANIDKDNNLKHSQSYDNPVIREASGFSISEVSGLKAVFIEGEGGKSEPEIDTIVNDKYGDLYSGEIVISGDIYFENAKGVRIKEEPSKTDNDATVIMSGIDTSNTDMWLLVYSNSNNDDFNITPVTDADSIIRFTLPDKSGGYITLVSIKYK